MNDTEIDWGAIDYNGMTIICGQCKRPIGPPISRYTDAHNTRLTWISAVCCGFRLRGTMSTPEFVSGGIVLMERGRRDNDPVETTAIIRTLKSWDDLRKEGRIRDVYKEARQAIQGRIAYDLEDGGDDDVGGGA